MRTETQQQNHRSEQDFDVIIVGGGMVGASLACALENSPLKVAVIEATDADAEFQPSFDARTVALAEGSRQILQAMGLWDSIEALGVTPIKRIHVSDRGHLGSAHMDARQEGVEALGYVVETRIMGKVLRDRLTHMDNLTLFCPASVVAVDLSADAPQATSACVEIMQDGERKTLHGRLVVAADGGQSMVRKLLGIDTFKMNYGQHAVIANVAVDRLHHNIAYERFTAEGPMALLPSRDQEGNASTFALVWTVREAQRDRVLALDDAAFLAELQQRIGPRAGRFIKVGTRSVYPLGWMQSREHVRPRLAIIGNAAHSLHPVAGQGFNLGLRDVASLAQVIVDALDEGRDPGDIEVLKTYARWRRHDQMQTALMTDGMVRLFSTAFPPMALARNLGLTLFEIVPPLKHALARHAMGYIGKLPRLARGLRL